MKSKNMLMVLWIAGALIGMVPSAYAVMPEAGASQGKMMGDKKEAKKQELYKELSLTDEQKKLLEENKEKNRAQVKALFQQMKDKRTLLSQELQKPTLDMEKIQQINNDMKTLDSQMSDLRLEGILEVRKILTPEQFGKFISKMEEHKQKKQGTRSWRKHGKESPDEGK